ncbi:MAG TPA: DUF2142 domain-containing protein [Conexibacter sp.]|jgi:hypothetical protein|nr:DUF2142 domain-containing protein [Conexibacter sp.]
MSRTRLRTDDREAEKPARPLTRHAVDRRALACLAVGLLVLAGGLVAALSHSAQRRTGTNGVWPQFAAGELARGQRACQDGELLPAGTAEAQLVVQPLQAVGPRVTVTLSRQGRTLQRAFALVAARNGTTLRVPLVPVARDLDDVTVCLTPATEGRMALIGGPTPPVAGSLTIAGQQTGASLAISYMAAGASSWWGHASTVADRMALGRGDWGGRWLVWGAGALLLASLALVGGVLVRGVIAPAPAPKPHGEAADGATDDDWRARLRGIPALAWAIVAVAVCNAAAWSILTPAFQVPDEQTHVAYAQQIAEAGRPPIAKRGDERLAPELLAAMALTRFGTLDARSFGAAVWSPLQQRLLDTELHTGLARHSENDTAGPAAPEPPLYYALEAIPYRLASGVTLLDRIALMRLLSALMAGVTTLFVFLFVRECLPGRPWGWTVGALGAALSPVLGFVSGGVNPDALLFPICAALFYALAVAFRRGLTTGRAAWIGAILAAGLIGKINFYGLVPGALLALALAARASAGGLNMRAARLVGVAVGIAVTPFLLLTALDALAWDRAFVLARTPAERPEDHGNLGGQLGYLWQVFLPRLPGQSTAFPEFYPGYQLWLKGFVGKFGWTVVGFSEWAYRLGAVLLGVVVALAARATVRERRTLRTRRWELLGYAAMTGGLLLLIGLVALRGFAPGISGAIQGRYLLPLLALFAALLALAARGAGERWGRTVGVALVLVCVGWSLFGQLLTIAWFYG